MTPFEIEEAIQIGLEIAMALVNAVRNGLTKQEALKHAHSIIAAKLVIDADVDAAARGASQK